MKIGHTCSMRTDGQTDKKKLIAAFCNFANASKIIKSTAFFPNIYSLRMFITVYTQEFVEILLFFRFCSL